VVVSLKERLTNGEVALGFALVLPAAAIIEHAGKDWDWIWIDSQHGQHDYRSMLECVRVADACGVAPIVRVPGHDPGAIGRVLDMRPTGIMVPMVDSPDDAHRIVEAVRFPPLGKRSYGGRRAIDMEGREYFQTADDNMLLLTQIETREAVENAEAIAATEGVDVLFFGPDDMKVRLGIPINTPATESDVLARAMADTAAAAKNAGKCTGCIAATPDSLVMATSLGYRLIVGGGDVPFLRATSPARLAELRAALST